MNFSFGGVFICENCSTAHDACKVNAGEGGRGREREGEGGMRESFYDNQWTAVSRLPFRVNTHAKLSFILHFFRDQK